MTGSLARTEMTFNVRKGAGLCDRTATAKNGLYIKGRTGLRGADDKGDRWSSLGVKKDILIAEVDVGDQIMRFQEVSTQNTWDGDRAYPHPPFLLLPISWIPSTDDLRQFEHLRLPVSVSKKDARTGTT